MSELTEPVTPVDLDGYRLIAVSGPDREGVFEATCPHRGAHLGFGGRLDAGAIVCPFHGHRIALGRDAGACSVAEHPSVRAAGGLFVLLGDVHGRPGSSAEGGDGGLDTGLTQRLEVLRGSHHIRPAFQTDLAVPAPYVIENAVDAGHFAAVHGLASRPRLERVVEPREVFAVRGEFEMVRANQWQVDSPPDAPARARFAARIYSPMVVVSELGDPQAPDIVITAATPTGRRSCRVRVTVALPRARPGPPATVREVASLVSGSRTAFEQDRDVWEHLDLDIEPHWLPGDELVRDFHAFCARFVRP